MNTTDEIMAMADAFATAHRFRENSAANARATLKTAIKELVKQAAWAHHTPALLTEADAVADLAGVARPGAEPVAWGWRRSDGLILDVICPDEHAASPGDYTVPLYTTPQASQLEQDAAEPVAWRWRASDVLPGFVMSENPEAALVAAEYGRNPQPLYTTPQASQPEARPGAEPVAWSVFDKRTKKHWYTNESRYTSQHYANEYSHREPDGTPNHVVVPLYTTPQASQLPQGWCAVKTEGLRTHVWPMSESQITALALSAPPPQASQPAQDAVDAERYRWLRDRFLGTDYAWGHPSTAVWVFETDAPVSVDLGASIDAAIAAQKGKP